MGGIAAGNQKYSRGTAVVYIFNLIVGVGALNLPLGFHQAGVVLGALFLTFIAFLSYITATWVIESQASANALLYMSVLKKEEIPFFNASINPPDEDEDIYETERFEITQRTEVALMADLFLGKYGKIIFYLILGVYLLGDLAIYAVSVPKSVMAVTGGFHVGHRYLSADDVYYFYVLIFAIVVVPFSMFNFQKTKYLQIGTLFCRNLAFFTMIILAIIAISDKDGVDPHTLHKFEPRGLPDMFGVSVYAFMCHHSLPGIITPINNKRGVHRLVGIDFLLVLMAYIVLCLTAQFAFGSNLEQLYNLNFASYKVKVIADFLALYPVFTLTTNYPLIAITLRNNLLLAIPESWGNPRVRYIVMSLFASIIPIVIAFFTKDVDTLVSFTGSYAGLAIQMLIPACLVFYSRRIIIKTFGPYSAANPYKSFFSHSAWIILVVVMSIIFLLMVTFNHINKYAHIIKY